MSELTNSVVQVFFSQKITKPTYRPWAKDIKTSSFKISRLESFLCKTELENCGTGMMTVGIVGVAAVLSSSSKIIVK